MRTKANEVMCAKCVARHLDDTMRLEFTCDAILANDHTSKASANVSLILVVTKRGFFFLSFVFSCTDACTATNNLHRFHR